MHFDYFDSVKAIMQLVEEQEGEAMEKAVETLVTAIQSKHSIYSFGASHAGILSEELYYRAGGLVVINPIFGREIMLDTIPVTTTSKMERCIGYGTILAQKVDFKEGDVLIVHSVSGRNPVTIEVAVAAKEKGVTIIGITNLTYSMQVTSRHTTYQNLYTYCDIVLDNHGDIGDGCVAIEGSKQKVSPTSTVIGAYMLNAIVAATTQQLHKQGCVPLPICYSANIDGGDALNREVFNDYKDMIHFPFK